MPGSTDSASFPFPPEAQTRVRRALGRVTPGTGQPDAQLLEAVGECVSQLRQSGASPEAMVVTMKSFLRESGVADARAIATNDRPLMEQLVQWCIAEYYKTDKRD